jgi:hypothetical protein
VLGLATLLQGYDHVAFLMSLVNLAMSFDDLVKRVAPVYGRPQPSLFDQAFEEGEVVGLFTRVLPGHNCLTACQVCRAHAQGAYRRGGVQV